MNNAYLVNIVVSITLNTENGFDAAGARSDQEQHPHPALQNQNQDHPEGSYRVPLIQGCPPEVISWCAKIRSTTHWTLQKGRKVAPG